MIVFVPSTLAAAAHLRSSGSVRGVVGYAPNPELRHLLGDEQLGAEELDYVALNHAGTAALASGEGSAGEDGTRVVLAVDVSAGSADSLGAVTLNEFSWTQVRSLFADESAAASAVDRARTAVRGLDLVQALLAPEVAELDDTYDLLWFAPDELDDLIAAAHGRQRNQAD